MKTVQEIYTAYRIMPSLQLHQLRVAAVAQTICDHVQGSIDSQSIVIACLFHDMGNIIKSDLTSFPDFLEPEGREYWEGVKKEYIEKYGGRPHEANVTIAKEINLPDASIRLIDGVSFSHMDRIVESPDLGQKICEYSDCRIGPRGVLLLKDRLEEARKRYVAQNAGKGYYTEEGFSTLFAAARRLESQVSEAARISPEDITDAVVAPLIERLRDYKVA